MKKTKTLLSALALTMSLTVFLGGCGSSTSSNSSNEPIKIEYWHVASDSFGGKTLRELVDEFNKENPDIKVEEKFNPDMYKGLTQNVQAAIASGNTPDVVQMGYNFLNYANENFPHADINEVFKDSGDPDFIKNTFTPEIAKLAQTAEGKQIGVPYSISIPVLYYNPELFKKAGLDPNKPPTTWKEVEEYAQKITNVTHVPSYYMQEYADTWTNQAMVESNGGSILTQKDDKWIASFDTPQGIEAYDTIYKMIKNGTGLHATNEEGFTAFTNGKIAMVTTTIGKRTNFEKSSKFNVMVATFPRFGDKQLKLPAGGNFLMILSKDPNKQKAAAKFITFLESEKALAKWNTGTGYLPPRKNSIDSPSFKTLIANNNNIKIALDDLKYAVPWVSFPGKNGLEAEQVLINARDAILNGSESASIALKKAATKINSLLN